MTTEPRLLGKSDEPQGSGVVVAVHYGDYRCQEIWVSSGSNIGAWYPLGGEFGRPKVVEDNRSYAEKTFGPEKWQQPPGTIPLHPDWYDVLKRGPVVLLTPAANDAYVAGWQAGRKRLVEEITDMQEFHDQPPEEVPDA